MKQSHVGLWMIGACGRVGSAVALGIAALRQKLTSTAGLVSSLPAFDGVDLMDPARIVVGGHEIRSESLRDAVQTAHRKAGLFSDELIAGCTPRLREFQRNIRKGAAIGISRAVRAMLDGDIPSDQPLTLEAVERLGDDIRSFKRRHKLDTVIVVNVASSEPPVGTESGKRMALPTGRKSKRGATRSALPSSSVYALAAIEAGFSYINFTPSPGIMIRPVRERADQLGVPYMGNDGKTGETLVKSALAPMFAMRNLPVLSWVGQNILGNRDGEILRDPATRAAKIGSKDKVVSRIVPGSPTTGVSIDYVPSLDDWKVAWDYIHFEGFLATKMAMQFTWQGCDSILAAPLIIDLVRFAALEVKRGAAGPMRHLAFFFKDPIDVNEHDLPTQWRRLVEHVRPKD